MSSPPAGPSSSDADGESGVAPAGGGGARPQVTMYRSGRLEIISTGMSSNTGGEGGRPIIEIDLSISRRMR